MEHITYGKQMVLSYFAAVLLTVSGRKVPPS